LITSDNCVWLLTILQSWVGGRDVAYDVNGMQENVTEWHHCSAVSGEDWRRRKRWCYLLQNNWNYVIISPSVCPWEAACVVLLCSCSLFFLSIITRAAQWCEIQTNVSHTFCYCYMCDNCDSYFQRFSVGICICTRCTGGSHGQQRPLLICFAALSRRRWLNPIKLAIAYNRVRLFTISVTAVPVMRLLLRRARRFFHKSGCRLTIASIRKRP